jgi:hypothetical protein
MLRTTTWLFGLMAFASAANAQTSAQGNTQGFRIDEASTPSAWDVAQIKPKTIEFRDQPGDGLPDTGTSLMRFDDWARVQPTQKKFLALFPGYTEPTISKSTNGAAKAVPDKLYIYLAQARFILAKPPASIDLTRFATLPFLERIDPAIKHKLITAADVMPLTDPKSAGNLNPDRKWCEARAAAICIQSSYKLEGKLPIGIMLVNKLRDSAKKVSDHLDFQSELAPLGTADIDQQGLQELTALPAPVTAALEQNIFYVNQIMKFGKFLAVFQSHPTDANKTVVTAYMVLAIEASVLDKKRQYEKVPVLRNLVPAQVLMGKSSFNSGSSISSGLPNYARNQIRTIAGILDRDPAVR